MEQFNAQDQVDKANKKLTQWSIFLLANLVITIGSGIANVLTGNTLCAVPFFASMPLILLSNYKYIKYREFRKNALIFMNGFHSIKTIQANTNN